MIRIIFGIILLIFCSLGIMGSISMKQFDIGGYIFLVIFFLIPGILLVYYGSRSHKKKKHEKQFEIESQELFYKIKNQTNKEELFSNKPKLTGKENEEDMQRISVNLLVVLYNNSPRGEGFIKDSASASEVREIGRKLDESGGFKLMLKAHEAFKQKLPSAARNLEFVWDGIGCWQG